MRATIAALSLSIHRFLCRATLRAVARGAQAPAGELGLLFEGEAPVGGAHRLDADAVTTLLRGAIQRLALFWERLLGDEAKIQRALRGHALASAALVGRAGVADAGRASVNIIFHGHMEMLAEARGAAALATLLRSALPPLACARLVLEELRRLVPRADSLVTSTEATLLGFAREAGADARGRLVDCEVHEHLAHRAFVSAEILETRGLAALFWLAREGSTNRA